MAGIVAVIAIELVQPAFVAAVKMFSKQAPSVSFRLSKIFLRLDKMGLKLHIYTTAPCGPCDGYSL
jgi:hypothetical protein